MHQSQPAALRYLGTLLVKGEGGARDVNAGVACWRRAAAEGNDEARANIKRLDALLRETEF